MQIFIMLLKGKTLTLVSRIFWKNNINRSLCGDLWEEENVQSIKNLNSDLVFWPVYTDLITMSGTKI